MTETPGKPEEPSEPDSQQRVHGSISMTRVHLEERGVPVMAMTALQELGISPREVWAAQATEREHRQALEKQMLDADITIGIDAQKERTASRKSGTVLGISAVVASVVICWLIPEHAVEVVGIIFGGGLVTLATCFVANGSKATRKKDEQRDALIERLTKRLELVENELRRLKDG